MTEKKFSIVFVSLIVIGMLAVIETWRTTDGLGHSSVLSNILILVFLLEGFAGLVMASEKNK